MRASDLNFPYPVLGVGNSILGDKPEVRMYEHPHLKERIAEPYRWDFDIDIKNKDIARLISEGKAQYMCEVSCSATLMRKCFFCSDGHLKVELQRREVNKRIEFGLYVVTTDRLPAYHNGDAHEDYKDIDSFDLAKGSPLAVLGSYQWDVDLCYEDLTSLRSILQFLPNTSDLKQDYVVIDTDGDYIKVLLPQSQYDAFMNVASEKSVANVIHSSLVLFALQSAIALYSKEKTHRWERALEAMVTRDDRFRGRELGDKEDAAMIATMLLNNPFKRLCDTLPSLIANTATNAAAEEDNDED